MSASATLAENLAASVTLQDLDAAAKESLAAYDRVGEKFIEKNAVRLDCGAGCSICCSLRVDVLAHEVFFLAHHVLTRFSPEQLRELNRKLEAHVGRVLDLTPYEHATTNLRCPMLRDDGFCGVYEARPRSCRRHHSRDVKVCQYTFDHPTDIETPAAHDRALYRALTETMQADADAYASLGYDLTVYELGTALAEALSDPAAWGRWSRGGPAFLWASITPTE